MELDENAKMYLYKAKTKFQT